MAHVFRGFCKPCISHRTNVSSVMQFRFLNPNVRIRKPRWMPTAKTKVFRIAVHPYVDPEEQELRSKLVDEYFRKIESIRKLFRDELEKKSDESAIALELAKAEEVEHERLMEENEKENQRVAKIREETLQREFQEKAKNLLEQYEQKLKVENAEREKIDQVILQEEEKSKAYITHENMDEAIEYAMDHPVNVGFCIDMKGNIIWEGTPPKEFEEYMQNRLKSKLAFHYDFDPSKFM